MANSQGIAPPTAEEDRRRFDPCLITADIIVRHAQRMLSVHRPLNDAKINVYLDRIGGMKARWDVIKEVETRSFTVARRVFGGIAHYVLMWNEGESRFNAVRAYLG